jgi:hypothetical protein
MKTAPHIDPTEPAMSRLVYTDATGTVRCVSAQSLAALPIEFLSVLDELARNLQLALDCCAVFGGVPTPVALAILKNIEPAHTAIDLAVRNHRAGKAAD